jgi:hypothetical protein
MRVQEKVEPLTRERWKDLVSLFGEKGAYGGCWCMWWRQAASEHERRAGEDNREALKALVNDGKIPGLLAYLDERPVGWCSVAPREELGRLLRSPVLKPVDERPAALRAAT